MVRGGGGTGSLRCLWINGNVGANAAVVDWFAVW